MNTLELQSSKIEQMHKAEGVRAPLLNFVLAWLLPDVQFSENNESITFEGDKEDDYTIKASS